MHVKKLVLGTVQTYMVHIEPPLPAVEKQYKLTSNFGQVNIFFVGRL